MRLQTMLVTFACALALTAPTHAQAPQKAAPKPPAQATYASPEAAAKALYDAVKSDDVKAIYKVLGPGSAPVIYSGDKVADNAVRDDLITAWDRAMKVDKEGDAKATLLIGPNETPFPFPLVRDGSAWRFDAKAGAEEVINRRIGDNELAAPHLLRYELTNVAWKKIRKRLTEAARVEAGPVRAGELEIRADQFQAFVSGSSVDLTRREFELIQLLADVAGQVLPREEIYQRVWGYAMVHGDRSVDVFVRKLRQKLERASPRWRSIHTHFGIGYRFAAESLDPPEPVPAVAEPAPAADAAPAADLPVFV